MSQIPPQEQADNNDCKVPSLELKPIQVSTFQCFLVQEHCDLQELFPFDALLELEQIYPYEGEVIQHWSICFLSNLLKNDVFQRDDEVAKASASDDQRHDIPNYLFDVIHIEYLNSQDLPFEHSCQVHPYYFFSCHVHNPLLCGFLDLDLEDAALDDIDYPCVIDPPQHLETLAHFPLKPAEFFKIAEGHDLDHVKNGRLPGDGLDDLVSFGLDGGCGNLVEWLCFSHLLLYKIEMQAVGTEVIIALAIPIVAIASIIAYYWRGVRDYIREQFSPEVRIEENEQERRRREAHLNDQVCSICLQQPKKYEVSSTCGHSFCAECIFSLYSQHHQQIKCPLCRQGMSVLFRLFQHSQETEEIQQRMRDYNIRFDDNRSIVRTIIELPYVLQRLGRFVMSGQFVVYFLRSIHIIRLVIVVVAYLLMPFDLLPEKVLGIIGYLDDILLAIFFLVLFISIAALQFMRNRQ